MIEIATRALSAVINRHGAELTSLRDAEGRELMTNADPAYWSGHAPILFPIVGRLNGDVLRVDGREYRMEKHGFARRSDFELVSHEAARATFRLVDEAKTRAVYPFAFLLEIDFLIEDATLVMTARIGNDGTVPLPASFGWHPAFAWPLPYGQPRDAHRIVFDQPEPGNLRRLDGEGLIEPESRPSPVRGDTLPLADALFERDALIWDPIGSQQLSYGANTGPQLRIEFPDTPSLGIWTKPGARFVCIEPWHGIADPQGFEGEFADKPGVFVLAPGQARLSTMRVTLDG